MVRVGYNTPNSRRGLLFTRTIQQALASCQYWPAKRDSGKSSERQMSDCVPIRVEGRGWAAGELRMKIVRGVANKRDGCTMVPFSRPKRKFRPKDMRL